MPGKQKHGRKIKGGKIRFRGRTYKSKTAFRKHEAYKHIYGIK